MEDDGFQEDDSEPEPEMEGEAEVSPEDLRETVQRMAKEAVQEALTLQSRGRVLKVKMAKDFGRLQREMKQVVRRAVEGAGSTLEGMDLSALKEGLRGRSNTLMTRVGDEDLDRLDLLVESGLFESRSEAAAFLIHAGLEARSDLVAKVEDTAQRIANLKSQLHSELRGEG